MQTAAANPTARKEHAIQQALSYLRLVRQDLSTMGEAKRGTRWHLDRVEAERAVLRRLAMLGVSAN